MIFKGIFAKYNVAFFSAKISTEKRIIIQKLSLRFKMKLPEKLNYVKNELFNLQHTTLPSYKL